MIVAVLANVSHDWARMVRDRVGGGATVLEAGSFEGALDLLQSVPANLVVVDVPAVTPERIETIEAIRERAPGAVLVGVAPTEVIETVRNDELAAPDQWIDTGSSTHDWDAVMSQALTTANLRADQTDLAASPGTNGHQIIREGDDLSSPEMGAFHRLMSGVAGSFDLQRLLEAYADAVSQFSRCASFCLLWEESAGGSFGGRFGVRVQRGMRAEIVEGGRLLDSDALPSWYRRNRRMLAIAELTQWSERSKAIGIRREMDLFGGQVAIPLDVRGRLAGILFLGDKMLGECYATGELETLFAMSSYVAIAAEGIELHNELRRAKAYTDRIVKSMSAGLITLGPDERIGVCSPYAAEVLGLSAEDVEGADLRCLPSPLGDYLYAALKSPQGTAASDEVTIRGGEVALRVSTSSLLDDAGGVLGGVLLLEDITAEMELAQERSRRERLDVLTQIVGRIAHEVKNPLTAVKTYAELIGDRGPDEELCKFWSRTVLPEIDHLDELLRNLLRMVEQPEPNFERAEPLELIDGAISRLSLPEDVRDQIFELEMPEGLPLIMVDPSATMDAFSYLLHYVAGDRPYPVRVHAAASTVEGRDGLEITMTRISSQNGTFEPEHVFDPLYAMQHPEADLGPVISQKIITNQQGLVEAHHEDGHVTMKVSFPAASASGGRRDPEVGD